MFTDYSLEIFDSWKGANWEELKGIERSLKIRLCEVLLERERLHLEYIQGHGDAVGHARLKQQERSLELRLQICDGLLGKIKNTRLAHEVYVLNQGIKTRDEMIASLKAQLKECKAEAPTPIQFEFVN